MVPLFFMKILFSPTCIKKVLIGCSKADLPIFSYVQEIYLFLEMDYKNQSILLMERLFLLFLATMNLKKRSKSCQKLPRYSTTKNLCSGDCVLLVLAKADFPQEPGMEAFRKRSNTYHAIRDHFVTHATLQYNP